MKNALFAATAALALAASASPAAAVVATFDFESQPTTFGGSLAVLALIDNGLTATFTRPGSTFDIIDISVFGADPSFGQRSLDPFNDTGGDPFIVNFSQAVVSISLSAGDFGMDSDVFTVQAFAGANATGALIDSASQGCCGGGNTFQFITLADAGGGIQSLRFIGGSASGPNSLYYDNLVAEFGSSPTVPEPGILSLLGLGLAGFGLARRRVR